MRSEARTGLRKRGSPVIADIRVSVELLFSGRIVEPINAIDEKVIKKIIGAMINQFIFLNLPISVLIRFLVSSHFIKMQIISMDDYFVLEHLKEIQEL
jgi:hypothetical protein